jgi:hypothetical protein
MSSYITTKTPADNAGFSFGGGFEAFYVEGIYGNVYNNILIGAGYESTLGIGPLAGGLGSNASITSRPTYRMYSINLIGSSIDVSYQNWKTKTKIYNLFYKK